MNSICEYLSNTNVQLGASYAVGQQSNTKYKEGYLAAAKYINAAPEEIGNEFRCLSRSPLILILGQFLAHQQRSYSVISHML
jgi:hypothetical protein